MTFKKWNKILLLYKLGIFIFQYDIHNTGKPVYNGPVYSGYPVRSSHPAYNGHLAISQGWPLYTGLTVSFYVKLNDNKQCPLQK